MFEIEERYEDALESFEHAILAAPDNADTHEHAGRMMAKLERHEEAIVLLQRSIEIEDTSRRQIELGGSFAKLDQWSDSETAFGQAIKLGASGVDIRYALAVTMANQQKCAEAETILEDILRQIPNHALAKQLIANLQQRPSAVVALDE